MGRGAAADTAAREALLIEILALEFDDRSAGELFEQQMEVVKTS
jgi:hypothetical protein